PGVVPAILSGPSFAGDVASGQPTAVTLAAPDEAVATALALALGSATFRPYHSTDVRGGEIGGAPQNRPAIAGGLGAGRGPGRRRVGGAHHPRLCRADPLRPRLWGAHRNAHRAVRPGRPHPDLLERAVAQFFARRRARQGRGARACTGR